MRTLKIIPIFFTIISITHSLANDQVTSVTCKGNIWKEDFSSGKREVIVTDTEVDLKFRFDLSKFEKYTSWANVKVYTYTATVEERIIEPGMDADNVTPIIHKDVLLKNGHGSNQYLVHGFNPSLGLAQKKTYGDEDLSGHFFVGDGVDGVFNNKKGYDYTPQAASDYRYTIASCHTEF